MHGAQIARQGQNCEKCAKLFFVPPDSNKNMQHFLADRNARVARFDAIQCTH